MTIQLRRDEVLREKVRAALNSVNNYGMLYITNRRLVWNASMVRPPLTTWLAPQTLELPLADIDACTPAGFAFDVSTLSGRHRFVPFTWWLPVYLHFRLARRLAATINDLRSAVLDEARDDPVT